MDGVADALLSRFYDSLGKTQGLSVPQYQELITGVVLYIKEQACSARGNDSGHVAVNENNKIIQVPTAACVSNNMSAFVDVAHTHLVLGMGDGAETAKVFMRKGYNDEDVAQCFCSKTKSHSTYKQYLHVLREVQLFRKDHARPFLELLMSRGYAPRHILDVGANIGEYAASISHLFPAADVFMIEASQDHELFLQHLRSMSSRFRYEIAAVMDEVKNMSFYMEHPPDVNELAQSHYKATGNSLFKENSPHFDNSSVTIVETATIDSIMAKHGITNIDFIKFDIQGAELFALKGAQNTLKGVDVIQLEIHIAHLNTNAPSFFELHAYMNSIGFGIRDQGQTFRVVKPMEILVGMDFFWVRKSSPLWARG